MIEYFNINYERSILSSLLFEPIIFDSTRDTISMNDFYLPSHQNIFNAMCMLVDKDKPIDEEFIKQELLKINLFDEQTLSEIMISNPISDIKPYLNEIKDLSSQRKLITLSIRLKEDISIDEKLEVLKNSVISVEDSEIVSDDFSGEDILRTEFKNKITYETGISAVDEIVGGLEKGQLIYVTGAEETGKTHITYKIMENISTFQKVGIISLEFGKRKYKERLQGMMKRGHKLKPSNIKASFESHSILKIEKIIKKWALEGVGFIVLDSFNLIENFKSSDNNANVIDTGRRIFKLTQQLDILLIAISTSTKADHKEGNPSIYGGQLLNHYCDQKWHIMRDLETEDRILWINKNKQNYKYGKEPLSFNKDGSITRYKVETETYQEEEKIKMEVI